MMTSNCDYLCLSERNLKKEREKLQRTPFQPGSVLSFFATQYRKDVANKSMNGVPGVIAFESQAVLLRMSSVTVWPISEPPLAKRRSQWVITHAPRELSFPSGPPLFPLPLAKPWIDENVADSSSLEGRHRLQNMFSVEDYPFMAGHAPIAMNKSFLGRTILTTRSVYLNTSIIISSSVSGAGYPKSLVW